jgi:hypothetical protein
MIKKLQEAKEQSLDQLKRQITNLPFKEGSKRGK